MNAKLEVVEIPDDVDWDIKDYDVMEHVAERRRTWHGSGIRRRREVFKVE